MSTPRAASAAATPEELTPPPVMAITATGTGDHPGRG